MHFTVVAAGTEVRPGYHSQALLIADNWNDWWEYRTQFYLIVFDAGGREHDIGQVKIGRFGMSVPGPESIATPNIPPQFEALSDEFFSVGQDETYYSNLNHLDDDVRDTVLRALKDVALDPNLMDRAFRERVMMRSLLRSVEPATVEGQFRRLATGGARLTRFHVEYTTAPPDKRTPGARLTLDVEPGSRPPTNIHVLIGRNGAGKTHLLHHMTRAIADSSAGEQDVGKLLVTSPAAATQTISDPEAFTSVVSVSFSAFDAFEPLTRRERNAAEVSYTYIGLKKVPQGAEKVSPGPKDPSALAREFADSVKMCMQGARLARWRRALQMLESDPIFADAQIAGVADPDTPDEQLRALAQDAFRKLSSGHKIVLLTVTRLVEHVAERSLVLLDEPEAHLHPPLLAAFVRALSDLLVNRNGVALIATHSPVVLQEVPATCVEILRRSGRILEVDRPSIETFGENVGVLTREVFGLEVTRSGFHRLIEDAVNEEATYERVLARFNGKLGAEARALVQGLLAARED